MLVASLTFFLALCRRLRPTSTSAGRSSSEALRAAPTPSAGDDGCRRSSCRYAGEGAASFLHAGAICFLTVVSYMCVFIRRKG